VLVGAAPALLVRRPPRFPIRIPGVCILLGARKLLQHLGRQPPLLDSLCRPVRDGQAKPSTASGKMAAGPIRPQRIESSYGAT
jgi:hypothetical protein